MNKPPTGKKLTLNKYYLQILEQILPERIRNNPPLIRKLINY